MLTVSELETLVLTAGPFDALTVYRRFDIADFLDLLMTENHTYHSAHPCGEGDCLQRCAALGCTQGDAAGRTLPGQTQHNGLVNALTTSRATWKLMRNQICFGRLSLTPVTSPLTPFNVDAWDGHGVDRLAIASALRVADVKNHLVVTDDLHTHMASDIEATDGSPKLIDRSNCLGAEFMTPSITSPTLGELIAADANPPCASCWRKAWWRPRGKRPARTPAHPLPQQQQLGLLDAGVDQQ